MGGYDVVVGMVNGLIKDQNITVPVALHLDHGSYELSLHNMIYLLLPLYSITIKKEIKFGKNLTTYSNNLYAKSF
mgnify:CR=1 FL=1